MNRQKNPSLKRDTRLLPILVLIFINLIIGAITFQNYGDSLDELRFRGYAGQSLEAYKSVVNPSYTPYFGDDDLRYYGPAYGMGVALVVQILGIPNSSGLAGDIWHLACFITFQLALLCLYLVGRRWLSNWAAFGIALLFSTQPLLWGHAFINPKDSPFLTFFLASIATGLWMCDRAIKPSDNETFRYLSLSTVKANFVQNWQKMPQRSKKSALITSAVWLLSVLVLLIGIRVLNGWIAVIVQKGYIADPHSLVGRLFVRFAHHANVIPAENYIHKAQTLFRYLRNGYIIFGIILIIWLFRSAIPWSIHPPSKKEILAFIQQFGLSFTKPAVILAGIVLGLTTSIRILGPLAGLIVCLYASWRLGKKALSPVLAYAVIALIIMYLTWPYLWPDPFNHIVESFKMMSNFQWLGKTLFNGVYYLPSELPKSYLPVLLSIQLTEPVIALFVVGLAISVYSLVQHKNGELFGLALVWFFIPVFLMIFTQRPMYDNFRQILFLIPPVFLISGLALDIIFRFVRRKFVNSLIMILLILPGISNGLSLHPYEYIYYNSLVGGVKGAFRKYETDYWMTSFREAANFLNNTAQHDAKIVSWSGADLVGAYTRPDLIVEAANRNTYNLTGGYNYAVLSSRYGDNDIYPDENPVFIVQRDGSILAVVKHLSASASP